MGKKILLGFHDRSVGRSLESTLRLCDHDVYLQGTADEMLEMMGIPADAPADAPPTVPFDIYMMDINLEFPDRCTCEPAWRVYAHVKPEVKAGTAGFLAASHSYNTVVLAIKAGIPACLKTDDRFQDFLNALYEG